MVIEKLTTLDLRQHLGDLLNRVALRHDEFIIERKGKPLAAMVPVEKLQQLERFARLQLVNALMSKKSALPQEATDALADEAKHRSRKPKSR
jgi:prevent-host-death family protein